VQRNRFWGTPIPLWVSDDFEEVLCIGSIAELEAETGVSGIADLHRETIDSLTIPSKKVCRCCFFLLFFFIHFGSPSFSLRLQGKGVLRRISQVFDCWFESGSMPYAQKHYPFEHKVRAFHWPVSIDCGFFSKKFVCRNASRRVSRPTLLPRA
jgi:isoleucyl-tRNA synthetase